MDPDFDNFDGPLPLFPLPNVVLFPYTKLPLHIFEPRYVKMVEDALKSGRRIGMVLLSTDLERGVTGDPPIRRIGCAGHIGDIARLPDGRFNLELVGIRKFEILSEARQGPYRVARVRWLADGHEDAVDEASTATVRRLFRLLQENAKIRDEPAPTREDFPDDLPFGGLVNLLSTISRTTPTELQELLEMGDARARARALEHRLQDRIDARRWADSWRDLAPEDPAAN